MKKMIALLLALVMVLGLVACAAKEAPAAAETPAADTAAETPAAEAPAADETPAEAPAAPAAMTEQEAAAARDAGTLASDRATGYEYNESNDTWYYSNYPNYKDFKADGEVKVGFICKFAGAWFTPKAETLGETVKNAGYSYQFFDCNSDTQAFLDNVQNAINQEFDVLVLTPPNTTLLAEAIAMLQEAGIAYMTTDDPGPDNDGFYAPHYGLDDYYLHNELGKACAQSLLARGWFDDVAADWSNFKMVMLDVPATESIHLRNTGFADGILEYVDVPEENIVWLDVTAADAIQTKFAPLLQSEMGTVDKWIVSTGIGSIETAIPMAQELNMNMENIIWADCFSTDLTMILMLEDETLKNTCWGVGLVSATSGIGMGELIIDLVENGTPFPAFTPYALNVVNADTVEEFHSTYYGG